MHLTPDEREEILSDYAESCRLRYIASVDRKEAAWALEYPTIWRRNCRDDAITAIRDGFDTWERVASVARQHKTDAALQEEMTDR